MSCVFLHLGQCGNQLGQAYWREVDTWHRRAQRLAPKDKALRKIRLPYSTLEGTLPCVLVDTEGKVVVRCSEATPLKAKVPQECVLAEKGGRGNNWAYGYASARGETDHRERYSILHERATLAEVVMERVRKLTERVDYFNGTVLFHSTAGGTGAGLGSAITERLRDEYPVHFILSVPVAPFDSGETPLQHYNTLFCLSWLQRYSDAALYFQNDAVLKHVSRCRTSRPTNPQSVSMDDLNSHIGHILCNSFFPLVSPDRQFKAAVLEPWELIQSLCASPSWKFVTPLHHCQSLGSWDQLLYAAGNLGSGCLETTDHTLSMAIVARSNAANMVQFPATTVSTSERLLRIYKTVNWNPFPVNVYSSIETHLEGQKVVTVLGNSSCILDHFHSVVDRARRMYKERAYVHWYERYGCEKGTFDEAFQEVEGIIDSYAQLH